MFHLCKIQRECTNQMLNKKRIFASNKSKNGIKFNIYIDYSQIPTENQCHLRIWSFTPVPCSTHLLVDLLRISLSSEWAIKFNDWFCCMPRKLFSMGRIWWVVASIYSDKITRNAHQKAKPLIPHEWHSFDRSVCSMLETRRSTLDSRMSECERAISSIILATSNKSKFWCVLTLLGSDSLLWVNGNLVLSVFSSVFACDFTIWILMRKEYIFNGNYFRWKEASNDVPKMSLYFRFDSNTIQWCRYKKNRQSCVVGVRASGSEVTAL